MADVDPSTGAESPVEQAGSGSTRSEFLGKASLGIGAAVGLAIAIPTLGMALTPAFAAPTFKPIDVGPINDSTFPIGKYVKKLLNMAPNEPDGYVQERVSYVRRNADGFISPYTKKPESFTCLSNHCAHLGCPVQSTGTSFVCPCHGGAYNSEGKRIAGPPVRGLDRFVYEIRTAKDGTKHLWYTNLYNMSNSGKELYHTKNGKVTSVERRGPGQHVDGAEKILYFLQP